jgi:hypothetical protein
VVKCFLKMAWLVIESLGTGSFVIRHYCRW